MKKHTNEFKVGVFALLCLAGLLYLTVSTGKLSFGSAGYPINVVFDEIAGLDKKAPVMLNGLEVGKVSDIDVSYEGERTLIKLCLKIDKDVKIRQGSRVFIKTLGLMGEKYIQIASSENPEFLLPGDTIEGQPYADMDILICNLNSTLEDNNERFANIAKNFEAFSDDIRKHPWKLLIKTRENR